MISKQPNTYIEKMQHFWTASNKVKERGWFNIGYNTQEVWEIQVGFKGVYCVFSGLRHKSHWQELSVKWSKVQHLMKNWTKHPLQTFSASKGWHFIPGELLSITDQDILYQDIFKGHVYHVNHSEQLDDLLTQIREKNLSDQGNAAQTSGISGGKNTSAGIEDEAPLEGTTKADVTKMVEATAMVYKFMEEQHKLDSYLPNNHQSCKTERDLMNLLWPYAIDSTSRTSREIIFCMCVCVTLTLCVNLLAF
jgi:hypothetical protein